MVRILVVDDSAVEQRVAGRFVERWARRAEVEAATVYAGNGREALDVIAAESLDLVLTDLQMPEMTGLELVDEVKTRWPRLPVVLMTAHGSEETAMEALRRGAAGYVPKRDLARELGGVIEDLLSGSQTERQRRQLMEGCLEGLELRFRLPSDLSYIGPLVGQLQEHLRQTRICDENETIRTGVALREALTNAIIHGNLEVSSESREHDEAEYYDLIQQRQQHPRYRRRNVHVTVQATASEVTYVIRDEGAGFDTANLPDPDDLTWLEKASGRGLLLIRTFMDEVRFNDRGNQITITKRRKDGVPGCRS